MGVGFVFIEKEIFVSINFASAETAAKLMDRNIKVKKNMN